MPAESDKIMFEVFREPGFRGTYRVVYFTELEEHQRDAQIGAALAGDHFYDGFISRRYVVEAKQIVSDFLHRLNDGMNGTAAELETLLAPYLQT